MKKVFSIFFTVLFCLTSSVGWSLEYKDLVKRDGIYYEKFSDVPFTGKINGEYNGLIKNGKADGFWISYHQKNGKLWYKGNFKNGNREGSWVRYWKNGELSFKGNYKNGKEDGSFIGYWDNGQLQYKGDYKNGKREGSWLSVLRDGCYLLIPLHDLNVLVSSIISS